MSKRQKRRKFQVGDRVTIGQAKTEWKITGFGRWGNGTPYAALAAVNGYATSSAEFPRLVLIEETGADR